MQSVQVPQVLAHALTALLGGSPLTMGPVLVLGAQLAKPLVLLVLATPQCALDALLVNSLN